MAAAKAEAEPQRIDPSPVTVVLAWRAPWFHVESVLPPSEEGIPSAPHIASCLGFPVETRFGKPNVPKAMPGCFRVCLLPWELSRSVA